MARNRPYGNMHFSWTHRHSGNVGERRAICGGEGRAELAHMRVLTWDRRHRTRAAATGLLGEGRATAGETKHRSRRLTTAPGAGPNAMADLKVRPTSDVGRVFRPAAGAR